MRTQDIEKLLNDTPSDVYDYWFSDDFVEDMNTMKRWADYGFWSKSALSDTNNSESYKTGLCVAEVAGQNPNKQITAIQELEEGGQGWESKFVAYGEVTGAIFPGHATQNGTAIVNGCKNPERAMLVLQELLTNKELNDLISYGIEGVHYEVKDGVYNNLSDAFPYEGFNTWNLRNGEYKMAQATDVELAAAKKWLKLGGFEGRESETFGSLSYGEQRAILILRSTVKNPEILILDEPCHGLDEQYREKILNLMNMIGNEGTTTMLHVTHDKSEILDCEKHVLELHPDENPMYKIYTK